MATSSPAPSIPSDFQRLLFWASSALRVAQGEENGIVERARRKELFCELWGGAPRLLLLQPLDPTNLDAALQKVEEYCCIQRGHGYPNPQLLDTLKQVVHCVLVATEDPGPEEPTRRRALIEEALNKGNFADDVELARTPPRTPVRPVTKRAARDFLERLMGVEAQPTSTALVHVLFVNGSDSTGEVWALRLDALPQSGDEARPEYTFAGFESFGSVQSLLFADVKFMPFVEVGSGFEASLRQGFLRAQAAVPKGTIIDVRWSFLPPRKAELEDVSSWFWSVDGRSADLAIELGMRHVLAGCRADAENLGALDRTCRELDLRKVMTSATVDPSGNLGAVSGLVGKLNAAQGYCHLLGTTVFVAASGQTDLPHRLDGFQGIRASTVDDAANKIRDSREDDPEGRSATSGVQVTVQGRGASATEAWISTEDREALVKCIPPGEWVHMAPHLEDTNERPDLLGFIGALNRLLDPRSGPLRWDREARGRLAVVAEKAIWDAIRCALAEAARSLALDGKNPIEVAFWREELLELLMAEVQRRAPTWKQLPELRGEGLAGKDLAYSELGDSDEGLLEPGADPKNTLQALKARLFSRLFNGRWSYDPNRHQRRLDAALNALARSGRRQYVAVVKDRQAFPWDFVAHEIPSITVFEATKERGPSCDAEDDLAESICLFYAHASQFLI